MLTIKVITIKTRMKASSFCYLWEQVMFGRFLKFQEPFCMINKNPRSLMCSSFILLNASRQDLCYIIRRIASVEAISFPTSRHFQSTATFNSPAS